MHAQDRAEAAARFADAAYRMDIARARFRTDPNPNDLPFRAWARRTYSPAAVTGKLARVVQQKEAR